MKGLLLPLTLGLALALCVFFYRPHIGPTGPPGTVFLEQIQDIAELHVLQTEISTLQPRDEGSDRAWRHLSLIVPVRIRLGVSVDQIRTEWRDKRLHVILPPITVLRAVTVHEEVKTWLNGGWGHADEDWRSGLIQKGEQEAAKLALDKYTHMAQEGVEGAVYAVAEAMGVDRKQVDIDWNSDTRAPVKPGNGQ